MNRSTRLTLYRQAVYTQTDVDLDCHFFRVACLSEPNTPLLLSAKQLCMLDLRVGLLFLRRDLHLKSVA